MPSGWRCVTSGPVTSSSWAAAVAPTRWRWRPPPRSWPPGWVCGRAGSASTTGCRRARASGPPPWSPPWSGSVSIRPRPSRSWSTGPAGPRQRPVRLVVRPWSNPPPATTPGPSCSAHPRRPGRDRAAAPGPRLGARSLSGMAAVAGLWRRPLLGLTARRCARPLPAGRAAPVGGPAQRGPRLPPQPGPPPAAAGPRGAARPRHRRGARPHRRAAARRRRRPRRVGGPRPRRCPSARSPRGHGGGGGRGTGRRGAGRAARRRTTSRRCAPPRSRPGPRPPTCRPRTRSSWTGWSPTGTGRGRCRCPGRVVAWRRCGRIRLAAQGAAR